MTQDANERFERLAEAFHRATGMIAPGKSVPMAMASDEYERDRQAKWAAWLAIDSPHYGNAPSDETGVDAAGAEWERMTRAMWRIHSVGDWTKAERQTIEDFILTVRHSAADVSKD